MDDKRSTRPVPTRRLFWTGVLVVFFLDAVGHTIDLYWRGIPPTFTNIYLHGTRAGHWQVWVLSCFVCLAVGSYVARQAIGAILAGRKDNVGAI